MMNQSAYDNLKQRKQAAAARLQALADQCGSDEHEFLTMGVLWLSLVGEHANDMECGMVMHAIHTKDADQLRTAFAIIQGTYQAPPPAKPPACATCGVKVKPGRTTCPACARTARRARRRAGRSMR
ncbi:hypothetical protein [Bifidobacterium scaligerum]|uniref:Uncharacterized protein n=1 Tax=Bifidobacterium scaligerum TaxID=2052656 RepID=A0A2M9HT50_9BIFI|nr:hypothetical protein [Bifidobacterium scaligerum]PJM79985.1 hypothetical protein CUU80_02295 [Bifidobacterium scaligerum]